MKFNDLSMKWKTALPLIAAIAGGIVITVIITGIKTKEIVIAEIEKSSLTAYRETVLNSLTTMMIQGNFKESAESFLEKMKKVADIRVIRAETLDKDFGKGRSEEYASDDLEKEVIQKGIEKVYIDGSNIRAIYPYVARKGTSGARKDCLSCHNVREGEVLGAISIKLSMADSFGRIRSAQYIYSALGIAGIITVVGIVIVIVSIALKPLIRLKGVLEEAAQRNDLTIRVAVEEKNEFGQIAALFNSYMDNLLSIMRKVAGSAKDINIHANDLSGAVQQQAAVTTEQSSAVTEITSTMEELSASSSQIAEYSTSVVDNARKTSEDLKTGSESVNAVIEKMTEINTDNEQNIQVIHDLGKRSKEITKIMEIINNIADQTKLIAFNAALEASSAGEAGKRFAVVAVEIRKLADSVMESTGEIESKINEIQEAIDRLVITSEKGSKGIRGGIESSGHTSDIIVDIVEAANQTTDSAKQISLSTQQQKTASSQVLIALKEIMTGSRQNTDAINQIKLVATNLALLSDDLKVAVENFKIE